jgi:hypothetical protein
MPIIVDFAIHLHEINCLVCNYAIIDDTRNLLRATAMRNGLAGTAPDRKQSWRVDLPGLYSYIMMTNGHNVLKHCVAHFQTPGAGYMIPMRCELYKGAGYTREFPLCNLDSYIFLNPATNSGI